ncbi:MAG: substrate-binding domain-containing protein [Chloroflexi bacterium]|nr:substrate-binding domain-containing protein [Chloroflexota bacterium]
MSADKKLSRRDLLKLAGAGSAGLVMSGLPVKVIAQDMVTIKVQTAGLGDNSLQPVADIQMARNPNVNVEWVVLTGIDHEEVAAKILALVAAGESIDVGYAATEACQLFAGQGLAAPLDDRITGDPDQDFWTDFFSDVHPSLVEAMMYEGSLYEPPRDFNAANMYFNTNVLAENGFDVPGPNWTKDDFVEIARGTTKKDDAGNTEVFGYGWTNRLWGSWMPWIFVAGGNLYTEERAPGGEWVWDGYYEGDMAAEGRGGGLRWQTPIANSSEVVEALELVVDLWKEGVTPDIGMGTGQTLTGFYATGKLTMTPAGGFWAGRLANEGMEKGDFDVQLWPAWRNQKHQFGTGGHWLSNTSNAPDEAWEFMKIEVSHEGFQSSIFFNPVIITTPARRSYSQKDAYESTGPANSDVFYDTLDEHPSTAPIPAPPWSNPMTTIFTTYTGFATSGEMEPQQALDEMQAELESLTNREGRKYYQE